MADGPVRKHADVIAWEKWCKSVEGASCRSNSASGEYLDNRLWRAFMAGRKSKREKHSSSFLALFKILRDNWKVYDVEDMDAKQKLLYAKVEAGDSAAAEKLLSLRSSYEYEEWHTAETEN